MHHSTQKTFSGIRAQMGAILILSLLFMAILTLLATTAMQSSHLSFKSQKSRIEFQSKVSGINQVQIKAVKKVKDYLDQRKITSVVGAEYLTDGFRVIDELLIHGGEGGEGSDQDLIDFMSYSLSSSQVDVYISHIRLDTRKSHLALLQHNSYQQKNLSSFSGHRYLYLQLHCIGRSMSDQNHSPIHIVSDFRFEV